MKMEAIRNFADSHGINPGKRSKTVLIRAIQLAEGNFDCFATANHGECNQTACLWREDCFCSAINSI